MYITPRSTASSSTSSGLTVQQCPVLELSGCFSLYAYSTSEFTFSKPNDTRTQTPVDDDPGGMVAFDRRWHERRIRKHRCLLALDGCCRSSVSRFALRYDIRGAACSKQQQSQSYAPDASPHSMPSC